MSHPWSAEPQELPYKPAESEYGWVDGDGWHPAATRDALVARCRTGTPPMAVWTPEAPRVQLPGEVSWLREALAEAAGEPSARRPARIVLVVLGLVMLGAWWYLDRAIPQLLYLGAGALVLAGLLWASAASRARERTRALSPDEIAAVRAEAAHARWLRAQKVTYTLYITYAIAAVGLCQIVAEGGGIDAAGLVPSMVRAGEWWRLATAPLLHGNFLHFFLNYAALQAFARMLEAHTHRAYVSLSFVVSAIAGGLASFLLPPEVKSIGASGGIMGLLGTLLVLGLLRRRYLPPHFARSLWATVGATAVLGLVGWTYIDNAAHLGGLVAGAVIGLLFLPHRDAPTVVPGRTVVLLGDLSMGAVGLAAAWAVWAMLR
ncbi:MAG: rhomboid family intramembrane serine protease [Gemmatimonadaceae bacterium]